MLRIPPHHHRQDRERVVAIPGDLQITGAVRGGHGHKVMLGSVLILAGAKTIARNGGGQSIAHPVQPLSRQSPLALAS